MKSLLRQGRSLEELFFHKHNQALAQQLHQEAEHHRRKTELQAATGIHDDALLEELIRLGIEPATMVAFGLLPLIEVAWADWSIQAEEREVLLRVAEQQGIARDSVAFTILAEWLTRRPPRNLVAAWTAYIRTLCSVLTEVQRHELRDTLLGRAHAVAEAAGGFLGLGNKTSEAEADVMAKLRQAFH